MRLCICGAELETREQLRRGYCSADCQRHHAKPPVFTGSRKPNTALTVIAPRVNRPQPHRMHGADRKKVSGE